MQIQFDILSAHGRCEWAHFYPEFDKHNGIRSGVGSPGAWSTEAATCGQYLDNTQT